MKKKTEQKKPVLSLDFEKPVTVALEILVPNQGECRFLHVFRPPTAEDRLQYYGRVAVNETARRQAALKEKISVGGEQADDRKFDAVDLSSMAAGVEFYDQLIIRVEGDYQFPRGVDWKKAVPVEHKGWAANVLLSTVGILCGSEVKN